ncbi:MAG TPA: hypothetical protein VNF99_17160 [Stellaceae bacterium]|nr:hypothetical protein [Stellaceae bacterium]
MVETRQGIDTDRSPTVRRLIGGTGGLRMSIVGSASTHQKERLPCGIRAAPGSRFRVAWQ